MSQQREDEAPPNGVLSGQGWHGEFGGMVPVVGQGEVDGLPFHFRARGRKWTLEVSTEGGDPEDVSLKAAVGFYHEGEHGPWPAAGYMPTAAVQVAMEEAVAAFRAWWQQECEAYLLEAMKGLEGLEPGWRDGDGVPVAPDTIAWVRSLLLEMMLRHGLPKPAVVPTELGGVSSSWRERPWYTSAEFQVNGEVYLHAAQVVSSEVHDLTLELTVLTQEPLNQFAEFVRRFARKESAHGK